MWKGISLNENENLDKVKRNKDAIKQYQKGLEWIRYIHKTDVLPIRMSLHNSYGVALHHLNIGNKIDKIPQQSIYHYRIARNIFRKYPNNEYMKKINECRKIRLKLKCNECKNSFCILCYDNEDLEFNTHKFIHECLKMA